MRPGFWSGFYRRRFVLSLRRKALAMARREPDRLDLRAVSGVRTFAEFDARVTARLFGFADATGLLAAGLGRALAAGHPPADA